MLARSTIECRHSFERCLGRLSPTDNEWLMNRLADFKLWAAGIGAVAEGHGSLEYRLTDREDIQEIIYGLTQSLWETLEDLESERKCGIQR